MDSPYDFLENGLILEIPDGTNYWLVRANGGKYYHDFLLNNFIATSDDEITLEAIENFPQLKPPLGPTTEGYKLLYQQKYDDWNNQQIAHAAGRTKKFIDDLKVNDVVIVPSHSSTHFIIGIVTSDPYEEVHSEHLSADHYIICPYLKRREVFWIKEVPREAISEKMYWILSSHQSILPLNDHSEYIDKLFAPVYMKSGFCHGVLKVDKMEGIKSSEWYRLYGVVEDIKAEDAVVTVKSNVESPGILVFISAHYPAILATTVALTGLTIGQINICGFKSVGLYRYFFGEEKLQRDKVGLEIEGQRLDNELKSLEVIERKRELGITDSEDEIKEAENTAHKLSNELMVSAFNPGKTLGHRKRREILDDQNSDESE